MASGLGADSFFGIRIWETLGSIWALHRTDVKSDRWSASNAPGRVKSGVPNGVSVGACPCTCAPVSPHGDGRHYYGRERRSCGGEGCGGRSCKCCALSMEGARRDRRGQDRSQTGLGALMAAYGVGGTRVIGCR